MCYLLLPIWITKYSLGHIIKKKTTRIKKNSNLTYFREARSRYTITKRQALRLLKLYDLCIIVFVVLYPQLKVPL